MEPFTSTGMAAASVDVGALLFPRSLALIGASPSKPDLVANILRGGPPVWGVHPTRPEVLGLPCFPTVADLPEIPAAAMLAVGHTRLEDAFDEAVQAGVTSIVIPGLGTEAGREGRLVAERIAARAQRDGIAMLGPNCMGVAVPGQASPWLGTIPGELAPGGVAVLTQSGSIGEAMLALGPRIGFRCIVSSGAEAVCDAADVLAHLARDAGTRAVGLFLEAVRRPQAFTEALARCAAAGKPVVCLKVGRSQAARRAALAHTGAVVGSDAAFSALLRAHGAIEVSDFPDLVETLEVLGSCRRPAGTRIAAVSESGGEGALLSDHAEAAGLRFEPLSARVAEQLAAALPDQLAPGNPLDAWAIGAPEVVFGTALRTLAHSGEFDVLLAQVDLSRFRGATERVWCSAVVHALVDAVAGTAVFPAVTTVHSTDPWLDLARYARTHELPLLRGPGAAMRAIAAAARWAPRVRPPVERWSPVDLSDLLAPGALAELESSIALERYGVRFPQRRRALTPEAAERAALELGPPVVIKVDGPAHKSLDGGVILDVASAAAARAAAERLAATVLVVKQVTGGDEVFCGMTRDPDYGPILAVGAGGAGVEARRPMLAVGPIGSGEARALAEEAGFTARAEEIADVLLALSRVAADHPTVTEIDVNPLILNADGVIAVDALIVVDQGAL